MWGMFRRQWCTHTQKYSRAPTLSLAHTLSYSLSHSPSHSFSHSLSHSLSFTHTFSLVLPRHYCGFSQESDSEKALLWSRFLEALVHTLSEIFASTNTLSLSLTLLLSLTHSLSLSLSLSLSPSLSLSLSYSLESTAVLVRRQILKRHPYDDVF